jgi:glutathione S-transferase
MRAIIPGMLRLYRAPYSTNVERVTLALAHKGLGSEVESVTIDYADRTPVLEVSGQPLVPVLEDDGLVVVDSLAILRHLEERWPEPPLFPADPARAAELDVFLDWFDRVWKVAPNAIEAELRAESPDSERIAELGAEMNARLDLFEAMLSGRDHLLGGFSAADCAAYPFLKYAAGRDPQDPDLFHEVCDTHQTTDGRPALAAWIERMAGRPGC